MCGTEVRIDCTKQFGRKQCDPKSHPFDRCVGAGSECDSATTQDSCSGSQIVYCDDGFSTKTDCKDLGFSGCETWEINGIKLGAVCK